MTRGLMFSVGLAEGCLSRLLDRLIGVEDRSLCCIQVYEVSEDRLLSCPERYCSTHIS